MDCRPSNFCSASFSVSMRFSMEAARRVALASLRQGRRRVAAGVARGGCGVGSLCGDGSRGPLHAALGL